MDKAITIGVIIGVCGSFAVLVILVRLFIRYLKK